MAQKLVVGPFNRGFRNGVPPFYLDNDSFPTLINAYQWRNRVKRKRGTSSICRLQRAFNSAVSSYGSISSFNLASNNGNLLIGFNLNTTSGASASITGATQATSCVLTATNSFTIGQYLIISGVTGMTQLNGNVYQITNVSSSSITLNVNSTGFTSYVSGGSATSLLSSSGNIVPGTVQFTDSTASNTYTDLTEDGNLTGSPAGSGTINYATGAITIASGATDTINAATFNYYPSLPVMDIEDLNLTATQFPQTVCFDTTYSYQVTTVQPYYAYDVSFYKNPGSSASLPGYTPKTTPTPVYWNGQNYQQFWSANYENSLWATNGITQPFSTTNIGMQYKTVSQVIVVASGPPAIATLTITAHGLVVGDFIFVNEFITGVSGINLQTGYVTVVVDANNVTVEFPNATLPATATITGVTQASSAVVTANNNFANGDKVYISGVVGMTQLNGNTYTISSVSGTGFTLNVNSSSFTAYSSGGLAGLVFSTSTGIAQYLTSSAAFPTKDCLRWYDGSPTSGTQTNPTFVNGAGWVNFCPPIYSGTPAFSLEDLPLAIYYLVGARMIVPYKDRILFLGPVIQSSASGPFYLQDTIIYSQNGTPYYTCSFTGSSVSASTVFYPILTPTNQGATANAYFADVAGFGGYITAGYAQPIVTVGQNQDVLIVGFTNRQAKVVYTGNDLVPFNFYIVNSELGSTATFGSIILDRGVITIGDRGITLTDQQSTSRLDLEIPDQVFEFDLLNNGTQRITAQRDFVNEWVYFSYPYGNEENISSPFPNQTLFYNYRDQSWAVFNESYTTYGPFRRQTGFTWQTVGLIYSSWNAWNSPWNASSSSLEQPEVIAGNQQGFIVARRDDTSSEAPSLSITSISGTTITSPNHGLNSGDYVFFTNAIGMTNFNSSPPSYIIWQVSVLTVNTFSIASSPYTTPITPSGTYMGNGVITRLYIPQIQTKQFPTAWEAGRKTRIGVQQYLFATTTNGQITLQLYLSQNGSTPFNSPPYVPSANAENNSVIYSNVLYTCQESTNLGLTPANINLQQLVPAQAQTWHRMNTSLIGDTVQIGFTLSDEQMFDGTLTNQIAEIELMGMIIDVTPSQVLS